MRPTRSMVMVARDERPALLERAVVRRAALGALAGLVLATAVPTTGLLVPVEFGARLMRRLQVQAGLPVAKDLMLVVHAMAWGALATAVAGKLTERLPPRVRQGGAGALLFALPLLLLLGSAPPSSPDGRGRPSPRALTSACTYGASRHYTVCPGRSCARTRTARLVLLAPHRLLAWISGERMWLFVPLLLAVGGGGGLAAARVLALARDQARPMRSRPSSSKPR